MASGSHAIKTALAMNLGIFVMKLGAAIFTKSAGMTAEAVHSLADSGNQILLLFGDKRSKKQATELHPFGHGKEQFFWSFIVAMLLFVLGSVYSVYEGIHKLLHPEPIQHAYINLIILWLSVMMEGYSWIVARKQMGDPDFDEMLKEVVDSKDADTVVVFVEDTGALLGLSFALAGAVISLITGNPFYDAISSICIGLLLFVMAFFLANEMRKLMIGETISTRYIRYARLIVRSFPSVKAVGKIKSMQLGNKSSLLMIDVDFQDELHDGELDLIIPEIKKRLKEKIPSAQFISIQPQKIEG